MSLIPEYKNDIFISYAHIDNLPIRSTRWVEVLHGDLENRLTQLLGRRPGIWRDPRMDGTEVIAGTLDRNISDSAILLTIISPSYLRSSWCGRERDEFRRHAELRGGLRVENKFRIVRVSKTFVPRDEYPHELSETLGFEFYREDTASGDYIEFKPGSDEYGNTLEKLALGLTRLVKFLTEHPPLEPVDTRTVYVGETTSDLHAERESIRYELTQNGYKVVPPEALPRDVDAPELESRVREYLKSSTLSLHLIGSRFGFVPEGGPRSIVQLQHDVALQRSNDSDFKRVIWIPKGLEESDDTEEAQKQFIKALLKDSKAQAGAELTRDKIEDVKTIIHAALKPPSDPVVTVDGAGSVAIVYLMCDEKDYDETMPLVECLSERKCEVLHPLFKCDDEKQASQYHTDVLMASDALLIYYDKASDSWAQMMRLELLKLAGLGRSKPVIAKAFYIGGEATPQKERFRSNEALVLKHYGGFSADAVAPFLDKIMRARGGWSR